MAKAGLTGAAYAFGATIGVVERVCGAFSDPETLAFSRPGEEVPNSKLYRVRFESAALWPEAAASSTDTVDVTQLAGGRGGAHRSRPRPRAASRSHATPGRSITRCVGERR